MVYGINTDRGILFISPNPGEFGRLGKPIVRRKGFVKLTPILSISLNIIACARPLKRPPPPGGFRYSINLRGPIKFRKMNQMLTSIYMSYKILTGVDIEILPPRF